MDYAYPDDELSIEFHGYLHVEQVRRSVRHGTLLSCYALDDSEYVS